MKQLRWVSSQNFPGREKCILASLEFPFFTHGEVSIEICITNAHFISRIPQKKAVCWRRTNMFSSLNLFHSQRYYRNLWPRGFLEARQEWSHKHLPQKCETFFIQTQNSMFSRPSETSNIGIDQFTNRPIEYCEFVIMSILLFLETLTFKRFLKPWTVGCPRKTLFQKNKKRNPPRISLRVSLNRSKRIFDFDQV